MTTMLVNYWSLQETIRHNQVFEAETQRHNLASEELQGRQLSLGYAQLAESNRHNRVMEERVPYQNMRDWGAYLQSGVGSAKTVWDTTSRALGGGSNTGRSYTPYVWNRNNPTSVLVPGLGAGYIMGQKALPSGGQKALPAASSSGSFLSGISSALLTPIVLPNALRSFVIGTNADPRA